MHARHDRSAAQPPLNLRVQFALQQPNVASTATQLGDATLAAVRRLQVDGDHMVLGARHKIRQVCDLGGLRLPAGRVRRFGGGRGHDGGGENVLDVLPQFGGAIDVHVGLLVEWNGGQRFGAAEAGVADGGQRGLRECGGGEIGDVNSTVFLSLLLTRLALGALKQR